MKKLLFKILSRFFKEEIEDSFIGEDIRVYDIDKKNPKVFEHLSNLYQSPEYKIFAKIISNRAKHLAIQGMKMKDYNEANHAYLKGQIFDSAMLLRIVKFYNKKYQNSGDKK